jgi:hypothetical protein
MADNGSVPALAIPRFHDVFALTAGGSYARQRHAEGCGCKKMVTPPQGERPSLICAVVSMRACGALGADRSSVRYRARRPGDEAVRMRLRELAAVRRRFGYRRLLVLMRHEGLVMNQKKFRRLYQRNGCKLAGAAAANGHSASARRWRSRKEPTSAGASTSCRMRPDHRVH